jgi:hypothetical protein
VAFPGNQRPPNSSAITFKGISTFVVDKMIPQGMQNITARKTVGFRERQNVNLEGTMHTTIQDNRRAGVSWESANTGSTQCNRGDEDTEVRVLGNLVVAPHETSVDVLAVGEGILAADQAPETGDDLMAMVEDGVGDGSGVEGEAHPIGEGVSGGEVSWRVCLITLLVEQRSVFVDDPQDVVR